MQMIQRSLAAAIGLLCLASTSMGAYLEEPGPEPVSERPPVVSPPPPRPVHHPLQRLVRSVRPGPPTRYRNLTIFPLVAHDRGGHGTRTLDDALSHGLITIKERDQASVGELLVRNDSSDAVFLMAGEIITGGKQNRIIRQDVLLAPQSGFVAVPVYCGEKDRWDVPRATFKSGGSLAEPALRKLAASSESQASIWGSIDRRMAESKVKSSTRDYQQLYENTHTRRELDECVARFRHLCGRRTVGLVAVSGNRIIGCDLFSEAPLLAQLWDKLCRSYAVDTLGGGAIREDRHGHGGVTSRDISRFLEGVFTADFKRQGTPGAGEATRIRGIIHGNALTWRGKVVHAALFPGGMVLRDEVNVPQPRLEGDRGGDLEE
jgi:hypothetical protein